MRTLLTALGLMACADSHVTSNPKAVAALMPMTLTFVSDSDGSTAPDAQKLLAFEPGDVADLFQEDSSGGRGATGKYGYDGKQLELHFAAQDFHHDCTVSLDPAQPTVSLPFRMLSTGSGGSTWSLGQDGVADHLSIVFDAAFLGEDISAEEAVDRAVAYAQTQVQTPADDALAPANQTLVLATKKSVRAAEICFVVGGCVELVFYNWLTSKVPGISLDMPSIILSNDALDEIHLAGDGNGKPAGVPLKYVPSTDSDPPEKSALFFMPLKYTRTRHYYNDTKQRTFELDSWDHNLREKTKTEPTGEYGYDDIKQFVATNGYPVTELSNDLVGANGPATVVELVNRLLPTSRGGSHDLSPGILYIATHGGKDGSLVSGDTLDRFLIPSNDIRDPYAWDSAFALFIQGLRDAFPESKYPGLAENLTAPDPDKPGSFLMFHHGMFKGTLPEKTPGASKEFGWVHAVSIMPAFWRYMTQYSGVDFSRSLVYLDSCDTDATPELREAIGARAHIAWNTEINVTATEIFFYICKNLLHHTHTAEEAYYNVLRVLRTEQMIYPEDIYIDSLPNLECAGSPDPADCQRTTREAVAEAFGGHGLTAVGMLDYLQGAWLTDPKPGNIWWLLFKLRWYIVSGMPDSLKLCWRDWWSPAAGATTGPMDVAITCYDEAPGEAPTEDEVDVAGYLDSGTEVLETSGLLFPRWTWNDQPK